MRSVRAAEWELGPAPSWRTELEPPEDGGRRGDFRLEGLVGAKSRRAWETIGEAAGAPRVLAVPLKGDVTQPWQQAPRCAYMPSCPHLPARPQPRHLRCCRPCPLLCSCRGISPAPSLSPTLSNFSSRGHSPLQRYFTANSLEELTTQADPALLRFAGTALLTD